MEHIPMRLALATAHAVEFERLKARYATADRLASTVPCVTDDFHARQVSREPEDAKPAVAPTPEFKIRARDVQGRPDVSEHSLSGISLDLVDAMAKHRCVYNTRATWRAWDSYAKRQRINAFMFGSRSAFEAMRSAVEAANAQSAKAARK